MKTGKSVQCSKKSGDGSSDLAEYDVQLVQKPLSRALDFVFDCYIHDEHVASVGRKDVLALKNAGQAKRNTSNISRRSCGTRSRGFTQSSTHPVKAAQQALMVGFVSMFSLFWWLWRAMDLTRKAMRLVFSQ